MIKLNKKGLYFTSPEQTPVSHPWWVIPIRVLVSLWTVRVAVCLLIFPPRWRPAWLGNPWPSDTPRTDNYLFSLVLILSRARTLSAATFSRYRTICTEDLG